MAFSPLVNCPASERPFPSCLYPPQILADFGAYLPLPLGFVWLISELDERVGFQLGG